jgi:hypothetical protein
MVESQPLVLADGRLQGLAEELRILIRGQPVPGRLVG